MDNNNLAGESGSETFVARDEASLWSDSEPAQDQTDADNSSPLVTIRQRYPRIADAIELMWGSPDMIEYFRELVIDDRRNRAGFPKEVLAAILKLSADHNKRFKFNLHEPSTDVWGEDPFYRHAFRD